MAKTPCEDSSTDGKESADIVDSEQEPLIETAEFKALVELGEELFGNDTGNSVAEDDMLTITDRMETLNIADDGDVPGFDTGGSAS